MTLIEIGNTLIKVAVFSDRELVVLKRFHPDEVNAILDFIAIQPAGETVVASTGSLSDELNDALNQTGGYLRLERGAHYGIPMKYSTPETLGIDRLANAAQALALYPDRAVLVIDMGTCVTYDLVVDGCFQGGVIAPGLRMRSKAMATFTAALPEVYPEGTVALVGQSTHASLQSGALNGWRSEICALAARFDDEYEDLQIVYTGGDLPHFEAAKKSRIFADPFWTLHGYNALYRRHAI